ncbi:hypothetical protein HPB47_009867 [Ixodes persulcatus]|uniref:Uncharacterized protein n=1 Tax=Ixodes persulcatus TaxID=34615 RepID=A0AC60P0Z8_IXOPE|nr:hypothetical protein HPB47_009867 [Ixodes persulcatus]
MQVLAHGLRRGFWRAGRDNVLRFSLGSAVQMGAYTPRRSASRRSGRPVKEWQRLTHNVCAALCSSVAAAPVVAVLDIKTRLYLQPVDLRGRVMYYSGAWDCVRQIYRAQGLPGYTKGLFVAFCYSSINSFITLLSWDEFKRWGSHSFQQEGYAIEIRHYE